MSDSMTFHLMFVNFIFSSVCIFELPPFGEELLTRLTICSLCILFISRFGLEGLIWVLNAPLHVSLHTFSVSIKRNFRTLDLRYNSLYYGYPA